MGSQLVPPVNKKDHIQGSANAFLELVEYGDYQCPHCGAAYPIVKKIQKKFGQKLKFIFRNFPLSEAHLYAFIAAVATEAAERQDQYWEMHDTLFENQSSLGEQSLLAYAKKLGLNLKEFEKDLQAKSLHSKVEADFESGIRSGVNGTPCFFVNGTMYQGAYDYDSLVHVLQDILE